jgi:hypothetical protein
LVNGWRVFLKRRLQYFVIMVFFPVVDHVKELLTIQLEGCQVDPTRSLSNVKLNERRL